MKSYFFQRSPVPTEPSTRGELMKLKPLRRPSIARVATTAVKIDVDDADQEHQREALDARRRGRVQDAGGDQRDDVGVDDRVEAAPVAGRDRGADRFAGAHLLLDALEDDDVGVGGDADGEDRAGDARERHRHGQGRHDPGEQQAVDDRGRCRRSRRGTRRRRPGRSSRRRGRRRPRSGRFAASASPSVADTSCCESGVNLTGSVPDVISSAIRLASDSSDAGDLAAAAQRSRRSRPGTVVRVHRRRGDQLVVDDDGVVAGPAGGSPARRALPGRSRG